MPVLYHRPDGDQRGVTITLTSHTWGNLGTKPACLLRFQFDIQYGRDQRFMEAALTLFFTSSTSHADPEITDYGPVHIESNPTSEEHVNKSTGQVAVSMPMVEGVETSVGAERQSSWTQLHSGKMQGHRGLQKGSQVLNKLSWQMEEDGRAKSGVFKISRAAVVVLSEGDFVVSAEKPWTNPMGWSWTPHNKKLKVKNPVTIKFEESTQNFEDFTGDDWNNMVLLGNGPQLMGTRNTPSLAATPSQTPATEAATSAPAEESLPTLPPFKWSDKHERWYYQNGSNYVWVEGPWGQEKNASLSWQKHPDSMEKYYDGEKWLAFLE
ncbi:hypothetical protein SLS60_000646 [Paraconiothyrium brasiliense]|uniref:Uncharacterized protein n=1 Tax=Paraconiothyrium brasiliense TaxID=300254 RepID=A0ABR3S6Y9_9PLEO